MSEKKAQTNGKSQETDDSTPLGASKNPPPVISRRHAAPVEPEFRILRNIEELEESNQNNPSHVRTKLTREELLAGHSAIHETSESDPRFKSPDDFLSRTAPKKSLAPEPLDLQVEIQKSRSSTPEPSAPAPSTVPPMIIGGDAHHFDMPDLATLRKDLEKERELNPYAALHEEIPPIERRSSAIRIEPSSFSSTFGLARFESTRPKEKEQALIQTISEKSDIGELMKKHETEIREWKEYASSVKVWQDEVMGVVSKLKNELKRTRDIEKENESLKETIREKDYEMKIMGRKSKVRLIDWMKSLTRVKARA